MKYCNIPIPISYIFLIYVKACIFYMLFTRNIGTPFANTLTLEQKKIKKKSSIKRRNIFILGLVIATLVVFFIKPFKNCTK